MPELKRNFLKGKMNKDLDERLVPNGEYRDALNIEISTSEGSNQGSVQTINGNVELVPYNLTAKNTISSTATTVGAIVDESSGYIYNFVHKAVDLAGDGTGIISDAIVELKPKSSYSSNDATKVHFTPVIVDVYEARYTPSAFDGNIISGLPLHYFTFSGGVSYNKTEGIVPGMRVQAINNNGVDLWAGADIRVKYQNADGSVVLTSTNALSSVYTAQNIADGVYIKFSKPRFLNFSNGTSELEANVGDGTSSSRTPKNNIITGINIVDSFLLFSDGKTEPKKINIERFKKGTTSLRRNSDLYIKIKNEFISAKVLVDESHITIARPNPTVAPTIDLYNNLSLQVGGGPAEITVIGSNQGSQGPYDAFELTDLDTGNNLGVGDVFYIQAQTTAAWQNGDVLQLIGNTTATIVTARITDIYSNNKYRLVILTIPSNYVPQEEFWIASNVKSNTFYNETFVYFAYRYVYTDQERSCISPYTSSAFIPGTYSYSAEDGWNLGVQNLADKFKITNFVPANIPKDVVEVELIIKTTSSENAYIFKNIKKTDTAFANGGKIEITTEQTGRTIASNQLTRIFDDVPRSAIAQEFGAGRVIYGNYKRDYNLLDNSGKNIFPLAQTGFISIPTSFQSVVDGTGNYAASRAVTQTPITAIDWQGNVYEYDEAILIEGWGGYSQLATNPWYQRLRKIAAPGGMSSDYFTDNQDWTWATKRGLYTGVDSLYNPALAFTITGSGTTAAPYRYYYTAQSSGTHTFNFEIIATYTPPSTAFGGSGNLFNRMRLAIYECDANGEIANLDASYATTPDPVWVSGSFKSVEGILIQNGDILNNGQHFVPYINNGVEVELVQNKKYQVFILVNEEPLGLESNGTATDFSTDGLSDSIACDITYTPGGIISSQNLNATPITIFSADISISSSPGTTNSISSTRGVKSVKSNRPYELGVVYRDSYGRETTVLIDETNTLEIPKRYSNQKNLLTATILNNAPYWAESYKFFIKEPTQKYHNIVMHTALDNNDNTYAWLVFNSADVSKVKVGDYLIQKKQHGTNTSIESADAKWKILDIQNEGSIGSQTVDANGNITQAELTIGGITINQAVITEDSDLIGKFFVKIYNDNNFTTYLGTFTSIQAATAGNGAVFETETKTTAELDLYYEIGSAYPIKLSEQNAKLHIPIGSKIEIGRRAWISDNLADNVDPEFIIGQINTNAIFNNYNDAIVTNVIGAKAFPTDANQFSESDYLCKIYVDNFADLVGYTGILQAGVIVRVKRPDGSYIDLQQVGNINAGEIKVKPYTHPTSMFPEIKCSIGLPWFNCFAFGNGVESDTIRDDFNGTSMYTYIAGGKTSGFKAQITQEDYKETQEKNKLIFSSIYNEQSGINKLNQFLSGEDITKSINPENGSVQKLFIRDTDLVVFCESKVFRGPINKDILYNAGGGGQLVSSNKTIGTLAPYSSGDYGISTNPESFASDEYRMYFVDKNKGAVLRLSKDGLTPIHTYDMEDWFNDNIKTAQAIIGSFDDKKGEYNVSIHDVTNPGWKKNVYTLSFDESINGWVSFKSFIPEQGVSLNNQYFTFKNGDLYLHHYSRVNRNKFYGTDYDSSITLLFNDIPSMIKEFSTLNYEGTQSRVIEFTNESGYDDGEYYNVAAKTGWYVDYINTDQQEGSISEFIDKEGKWFNNIKGATTAYTNANDGSTSSNNLDTKEDTTQGVGVLSANATIVSGSLNDSYSLTFNNITDSSYDGEWYTEGINLYGITELSGATDNTFIINPLPGFVLDASNFAYSGSSSYYSNISFANNGTANTPGNTITATITWINQSISADDTIDVQIVSSVTTGSVNSWNSLLNIATPIIAGTSINNNVNFIGGLALPQFAANGTYNLSANPPLEEEFELIKIQITPQSGYIYNSNTAPEAYVVNSDNAQAFHYISQPSANVNNQGLIDSFTLTVKAIMYEDVSVDDGFVLNLSLGNSVPIYAYWNTGTMQIESDTQFSGVGISTNGGAPTFNSSSFPSWLNSVSVNDNYAGQEYQSVTISTNANTTGLNRQFDIEMYSSADTSQSNPQTLTLIQPAAAASFINIYESNNIGQVVSDASTTVSPLASNALALTVVTNGTAPVSGDFTFSDTWLSFNSAVTSDFQVDANNNTSTTYTVYFSRTANTSGSERTITITATHSDAVTTDTFDVTQQGVYDSATDTVQFVDITGSPITNVNVSPSAGDQMFYLIASGGQPPNVGFSSDNFLNTDNFSITAVSAVSGQPYTHSFKVVYPASVINEVGNSVYTLYACYDGGSNATSNIDTQNPDDTITLTQQNVDFAQYFQIDTISNGDYPIGDLTVKLLYFSSAGKEFSSNVLYNASNLWDIGFGATTGYSIKYTEKPNGVNVADWLQSIDWSLATTFSAVSKPSWINAVAITSPTASGTFDGNIAFYPSTNSTGSQRAFAMGIFANGASTPSDILTVIQFI